MPSSASRSARFGQIKTKKELPNKFEVGDARAKPSKLGITVMSREDKMTPNRRRAGSRAASRGVHPYSTPSYTGPVSPR
jgi:hypothetical protein